MKYFNLILLLTLAAFTVVGQEYPDNSLGNLKKQSRNDNSFLLTTTNGNAQVTVMTPEIIRIRISKAAFADDFSYSVVGKAQACKVQVNDSKGQMVITTDSLQLTISKTPVRFTLSNSRGEILNMDDPSFGTNWVGEEVTTYKKLFPDEKFIGLGEKTGNLNRRGEGYTNWNSDTPGYTVNQDPIYATFPFYIGIHDKVAYGIFMDNSHRSNFNFGASNDRFSAFSADAGDMDYYLINGNSISRIIENYSWLTGRMPMPPIWGLGFQQSRWSYFPESEVLNLAKTFRSKKMPLDVLYLDIHYMDAYKIFTWNPVRFTQPKAMIDQLKSMGMHTAVIVDPGIKVEKGYAAYEDGLNKDIFLKYPDGSKYTAQVWPGWCNFPDFTMPAARKWWGDNFKANVDNGLEGFWNDMNEVASWGGGKTPSIVRFNWEGKGASYRQGKNLYGMLMARSSYEGTKALMNRRPLILTRAAFSGAQRYTAIWTGDNVASDEHMMLGCRLVNSLGITGMPFCGTDIGGFMTDDATASLFCRWLSIGSFSPFFRVHKHYDFKSSEPWTYGPFVEGYARNYITLRYKLLPYTYSAFYNAHATGLPISSSLVINNTYDEKCWYTAYQQQYMFGPSLLIAPVESNKELTKVYLPEGTWYDFFSGKKYDGKQEIMVECPIDKLPVFAKGGSFIPMQTAVQYSLQKASDTLYVHFFNGNKASTYLYYEDDGVSLENESGKFMTRIFSFNGRKEIVIGKAEGNFSSKFSNICLVLHGFDGTSKLTVNGKSETCTEQTIDILTALSDNDPLYTWARKYPETVKMLNIGSAGSEIKISW